jgi:Zn-dependent peptidase ImmA (M78 family)
MIQDRLGLFEIEAAMGFQIYQLTVTDEGSWSAVTLQEDQMVGVVLNPAHARTRQRAELMHELAHIQLKHVPACVEVSKTGLLLLSDYSEEQERDADWHAAAFLLPREAIPKLRSKGKTPIEITKHFEVSNALCEWRLRMTGVEIQMRRVTGR